MKQFTLIIILLTSIMGHAADLKVDGVVYSWMPDELAFVATGWDNDDPREELHIYNSVNGLDVTRIAKAAFEDNVTLRSVVIDDGITEIGDNAFCRCSSLKEVAMPGTLETIGEEAFAFCTALTYVVVPASVTNICSHAFYGCTGVTDVYFQMTTAEELNAFDWWDGVAGAQGELRGGVEFKGSRLIVADGTLVHVPDNTMQLYVDSDKFTAWMLEEGGDIPTEIAVIWADNNSGDGDYYDLQGHLIRGKPTAPGIYISNGKKIVVF